MRKLIIRYISMIMVISGLILIGIFYIINNFRKESAEIRALENSTNQVVSILELNQEKDKKAQTLFEDDYLNRAESLAYIIAKTTDGNPSQTELKELADQVQVEGVHLVNEHGVITNSSKKGSIGLNLYELDGYKDFIPLIESDNRDDFYIDIDDELNDEDGMVYVGIKPFDSNKGMIQIIVSSDMLNEYKEKSSIQSAISSMPTRDYIMVCVLDKDTGEVLGTSQTDNASIQVEDSTSAKEGVNILKTYINSPGKIRINQDSKLVIVKEFDTNLVVVTSDMKEIYHSSFIYIIMISMIIMILIIVIVYFLYKLLDSFIIKDLYGIIANVNAFVGGKTNVKFYANKKTELCEMADGLNKWIEVLDGKSERISKIASMMGNTFATYEYYKDLHQVYFSDNLPQMFEVTPEECKNMILRQFALEVQKAEQQPATEASNDEIIVTKSGRYLKIQRVISGNMAYAIIQDISEERKEHETLSNQLSEATKKASRDVLTGLYNREKAKEVIDEWFLDGNKNGVMLLMDLDNFKRVNDEKGHPEGDRLLKKFAKLLVVQFRGSDIKARIGGDEFIVFMPNAISRDILEGKIRRFLDVCRKELQIYCMEQKVSVSIGIALVDNLIDSYDELYRCADSAMYVAKRHGKDQFYINEENVTCMRNECVHCRKECKRRQALFEE